MSALRISFITGNAKKLAEVVNMLKGTKLDGVLVNQAIDLPELQGTEREISEAKALEAAKVVKGPVLVEDTSLRFHALDGLPGPYIKWFLPLGHDRLNKMLAGFGQEGKSATAVCTFALCMGEGQPVLFFSGECQGNIVPARPTVDQTKPGAVFGWDPIFEPIDGQAVDQARQTFGEMTMEQKAAISHRGRALRLLKEHLLTLV